MNFVIPFEPTPKGRPKVTFQNGKARTYTPTRTQQAESDIRAYLSILRLTPFPPDTPLKLTLSFFRCKPKWTHKNDQILPYKKPDLDNLEKLVMDAMNGIVYADDSQITSKYSCKRWTEESVTMSRKARISGKAMAQPGYCEVTIEVDN